MKKFSSIAFLLSAITGLSMLLLVSVFSLAARDAFDNRQIAAHRLAEAELMQAQLKAMNMLRTTQGRFSIAYDMQGQPDAKLPAHIAAMLSATHAALDAALSNLAKFPELPQDFQPLFAARAAWEKVAAEEFNAVRSPGKVFPASLRRDGDRASSALVMAINSQSEILNRDLDSTGPFIAEMMKIDRVAWITRDDIGPGRRAMVVILTAGTKPTQQQLAQIAENDGRVDAPWAVIAKDLDLPFMPAEIKIAAARVNKAVFGHYRAARQALIGQLMRGVAPKLTPQQWMNQSDPDVDTILTVANTALDISRAYTAAQLETAVRKLYAALGLLLLTVVLAALTVIVVVFRIIRPLRLIVQTMKVVVKGDLKHGIPFMNRQDEIGEFAHALKTFREQAMERQQMETELLHNQVAKESAEASNRIKTEFLANMSHELRTPLNAVIGFSDMMRQKIFGPLNPQYEDYAAMINESGQLLLNLVSDILDIAKIEAGKFTLDCQTVDLAESVESCLRLVKKRADDRHVALAARLPATPLLFTVDPRGLKQILLNLLSNAVKFTPEGGRIEVIGEVAGEMLKLTVRDNGIGIPASALKRIGHAFEQASNDPTRAREGTGLGLALVRALADQHGGSLAIDSIEHVGTTVTVLLPLSQEARKAA